MRVDHTFQDNHTNHLPRN